MSTGAVLSKLARNVSEGVNNGTISPHMAILIFVLLAIVFVAWIVFSFKRDELIAGVITKIKDKLTANKKEKQLQEQAKPVPQTNSPDKHETEKIEKFHYCMHCGAKIPDGAQFCMKCGKQLPKNK